MVLFNRKWIVRELLNHSVLMYRHVHYSQIVVVDVHRTYIQKNNSAPRKITCLA